MTNSPLIITGMHRSGTSLTAAFLQSLGMDVGEKLYAGDRSNQKGYFEDLDFLEFQRQMLRECCDQSPGWADWGWTESESLDRTKLANYREAAQTLIAQRIQNPSANIWGWKDPRTSLLLDFWLDLIPDARFLLIYRYPWDVADSILRLNAPIFKTNPDYAVRIWHYYNQNLFDFYQKHQSQSILISVNGFLKNCDQLLELIAKKFDIAEMAEFGKIPREDSKLALAKIYDSNLFAELDWQQPIVKGMQQIVPESIALLQQLDDHSDLPSNFVYDLDLAKYPIKPLLQLHSAQISSQTITESDKNSKYDRETTAVMEVILLPNSNCIDVGCHTGEILIDMLKYAPDGNHYAFEPLPSYYQGLLQRFADLQNVTFSDFALSDSERETSFVFVESNPGYSGLQKRKYFCNDQESEEQTSEIMVKTQLLDHLVPKNQTIDLIKIDVEGAELEVLKGAKDTIKRNQPIIIFEHGNGAAECYGTTPEMIYDLLSHECGLSISTMERFLTSQTDFPKFDFCKQFYQGQNYYFIAYKHDLKHYLNQPKPLKLDLNSQIKLLRDAKALDQRLISQLQNEILAMKSSKFWKIRTEWFKLKRWFKGSQSDEQAHNS